MTGYCVNDNGVYEVKVVCVCHGTWTGMVKPGRFRALLQIQIQIQTFDTALLS